MTRSGTPSPYWFALIVWKGVLLPVRHTASFLLHINRWLFSKDGAVFCSVLALALIFGGLWLLDATRQSLSDTLSQAPSQARMTEIAAPNPVVARIGTESLRLNDVLEYARQAGRLQAGETLGAAETIERGLVRDAVDQILLARAASEEGLPLDPAVRARLNAARNRILAAAFLEERVSEAVTPEAARELYQVQRRSMSMGDELRLRELVVDSAASAAEAMAEVRAGRPFAEVVSERSNAPSAVNGGDLGYIAVDRLPPDYASNVRGLSTGVYTLPFETEAGWVVLKVEGRQRISPPAYGDLEKDLLEFLRLRTIDNTMAALREDSEVEIVDPESVRDLTPPAAMPAPVRKPEDPEI